MNRTMHIAAKWHFRADFHQIWRYFDDLYQDLILHCLRTSSQPLQGSAWAVVTTTTKIEKAAIRALLNLPRVRRPHTLCLPWLRQPKSKWIWKRNCTSISSGWCYHVPVELSGDSPSLTIWKESRPTNTRSL